jgi:hypothetical protein
MDYHAKGCNVRWWEKFSAKIFRLAILRHPPREWVRDPVKDSVMILHYCHTCAVYRFDRHFDFLSQSEGFHCGSCNGWRTTRSLGGIGGLMFRLHECARITRQHSKSNTFTRFKFMFWRFMFFGLGEYLPHDRGGKTTGELEHEAICEIGKHLVAMNYFRDHFHQ